MLPVAAASWSSVEIASRNEPPAPRAISESAASGASIPSPSQTRRSTVTSSCSRGRWKTNVWQRERTVGMHLREVGRAEDEDEVRRRLLDQLQQGVPGGRRQLVRLVDDVDLVAALGGLQHRALADLAHLVDAPLRGGVHLDDVERGAVGDRPRDRVVGSKSAFGPPSAFSALARMRAIDVLPVPRGPAKRYACRTWPCSIAFRSVRTTASWPTTCAKSSGR